MSPPISTQNKTIPLDRQILGLFNGEEFNFPGNNAVQYESFGGKCRLHLQGRSTSQASNQQETGRKQSSACCLPHAGFLLGLFLETEDGGDMFL
jgi:hypothetical protein